MKQLRSYVEGRWHSASGDWVPLLDPCTEEPIAECSSSGVDFGAALAFARGQGGSALREMAPAERGALLEGMARALHEARDELIALSLENTGSTRKDAKFDIDGATFTLSHYGALGKELTAGAALPHGDGVQLGRSARHWGQHVLLPRRGAAVLINAFNFPAWGFAEKAACALLAGMPVIVKPATSSALVAARCVELVVEAGLLPDGAVSLICGRTGDLLERLGSQDVLSFTGSAATALKLRGLSNLLESSTRVNVEADSLNAAVLAPDVEPGSEMTQKTGQKCTAVRRILVPVERIVQVQEELAERLERVVVGNPQDPEVRMGPLATADQLRDAEAGVARLAEEAERVLGSGRRIDGRANAPGKGWFFGPCLLRCADEAGPDSVVHSLEVFGPVATLIPYGGSAAAAGELVARGGGCLVTSVYSNDLDFLAGFLQLAGPTTGRIYIGSEKVAAQLPGSGLAMPQMLHGGPGRAGGGEELGGLRGIEPFCQRVALGGDRALVERLAGTRASR
jgi:oxepin-CoA hydrolase/3-oxo-5,6-dehydrosuberyl-CoA semialdehyde dehydrogenase